MPERSEPKRSDVNAKPKVCRGEAKPKRKRSESEAGATRSRSEANATRRRRYAEAKRAEAKRTPGGSECFRRGFLGVSQWVPNVFQVAPNAFAGVS